MACTPSGATSKAAGGPLVERGACAMGREQEEQSVRGTLITWIRRTEGNEEGTHDRPGEENLVSEDGRNHAPFPIQNSKRGSLLTKTLDKNIKNEKMKMVRNGKVGMGKMEYGKE